MMARKKGQSLGQATYDSLIEMLSRPEYSVGSRLPSENDLSKRFSVSRPILRQALGRLQAEGKVSTRKGSGTLVLSHNTQPNIQFGPLANIKDVRAFLEFRCSLESEIAAHAALNIDRIGADAIRLSHRFLERQMSLTGEAIKEDIDFHMSIAHASRNRFFVAVMESFCEQISFGIRLTRELSVLSNAERLSQIHLEHAEITRSVISGLPKDAHDAMTAHLRGGINRLFADANI